MKYLLDVIKRYAKPYKWYLVLSVISNVLSALLNLLAFSLIMPILRILFQIDKTVREYIVLSDIGLNTISGWKAFFSALTNNVSYYVSAMIDAHGASTTLIFLGIYLVAMTFLKVLAVYMSFYTMIPLRTGVVRDLRNQINHKILNLPLSFFGNERKGDILARISGDVSEVENSVMSSLDMLIKNPVLIVIYIISMLVISWELTIFVFVLLPFAGFIMGKVGKTLKRNSLEAQNQWGFLMSLIEETLSGLRVIKAFGSESYIDNRFRKYNEKYKKTMSNVFRRQQLAHPMSEFLGTATIAVVLWYGGTLILNKESNIDAPTFIYYLVIFYSLINPMKELSKSTYTIRKGMASMSRIDKILNTPDDIEETNSPKEISFNDNICFNHVSFKYEEEWVLRDICLEIKKGQMVALVGHSGSGKTTMIDLLPRFWDVNEGNITIDGVDIRDFRVNDLRTIMGNVNQEAILFNDTIANNIAFGELNPDIKRVEESARIANAEEFINEMPERYNTNIGDRGDKLSGGQRQRLSIARALYKNPSILILDEATSALDTKSERLVQDAIENLMSDRTSIVIAHRLSTIIKADVICVIDGGRIVEKGNHQELLQKKGVYYSLYNLQTGS